MSKKRISNGIKKVKDSKQVKKIGEGVKKIKESKPAQKVQTGVRNAKKKARIEESQEIYRFMNIPNYITLGNAISGIIVMALSFYGHFTFAVLFLLLSLILDILDGAVARKMGIESEFGEQMDTLADIVAFGIAPAIFGFMQISSAFAVGAFVFFIMAGILRLARYNATQMREYYYGMPITFNGFVIPIVYFLGLDPVWYPYLYIFLGIMMIVPFTFKKIYLRQIKL